MNSRSKYITITNDDIKNFLKVYFNDQNNKIKTILKNMKNENLSSWVEIIWSADFRKVFSTKKTIESKKGENEKDILIFEELMIMIPLNYIYWREGVKNNNIFPPTNQKNVPICWAHSIATSIVLAYRRIIGRKELKFEEVINYLINKYGANTQYLSDILPEIMEHYGLHWKCVSVNEINHCNLDGSYHFYIGIFWLTGLQWSNFLNFFNDPKNKNKCITWKDLNKSNTRNYKKDAGHSVVLIDSDEDSLTFLNSYGKNWGNNGMFSVSRDAIQGMCFEFYSIFWLITDLTKSEQNCYENRREKAIEAFYQILEYTSLLSVQKVNPVIEKVKCNQNDEVKKDITKIVIDFCDNFWKTGKQANFQKLPSAITVCEYNLLELNEQIKYMNEIINLPTCSKKDFYINIKEVLYYFQDKKYITKSCIEILNDKNKKLIDINKECEAKFSTHAIESVYKIDVEKLAELIKIISKFQYFQFELAYDHPLLNIFIRRLYQIISNQKFAIGLYIRNLSPSSEIINYLNLPCFKLSIRFDTSFSSINENFFNRFPYLSKISIPSSITSIRDNVFRGCSSLTQITIPTSVTSIGNDVFSGCSSLTQITIPTSVTSFGNGIFSGCSSLKKITFLYSVTSIGNGAFSGCSSLTQITISSSVTSIGDYAFRECSSLAHIAIPSSVISIGNGVFSGCSSLINISIPSSVTSIGNGVFSGCSSLKQITIPSSINSIGDYLFDGCSSLKQITIPYSITEIGKWAFTGCSSLTEISIPSSVTSIGKGSFYKCSSLMQITIPSSVNSIGDKAFVECHKLSRILIPSDQKARFKYMENKFLLSKSQTNGNYDTIIWMNPCIDIISLPPIIKIIHTYAFFECSSLTQMTIPSSVTSIGNYAFSRCSSLTQISIPSSVSSIGDNAFAECSSLKQITIPSSVTSIGNYVFSGCSSLTQISIPSSVSSIGDNAFAGCSSLIQITIPSSVTSIGEWAFYGCKALKQISIPFSVNSIRDYTFYECFSLTQIEIHSSAISIEDNAFDKCSSLKQIIINSSVTSIG